MATSKIKKGDLVRVIAGKDKDKEGKVLSVNKKDNTVSNRKLATTGENNLVIIAISATVIAVVILEIKIKKSI